MPDQDLTPAQDARREHFEKLGAAELVVLAEGQSDKLIAARARITQLEEEAALAAACRPPEIRARPSDSDLRRLVHALRGTGEALYVLGEELLELRQVTRYATERAVAAESVAERVRAALATHPRCDVHPEDDPVSCGWKRAVADVQRALDAAEVTDRG